MMCERRTSVSSVRWPVPLLVALLALFSTVAYAGGQPEGPEIDAAFFYMEICPACENYQLADRLNGQLYSASKKYGNVTGKSYNVATPQHATKLIEIVEERGLPDIAYLSPVLIVNTSYIVGYEEIEVAIQEIHDTGDLSLLHASVE
jgi:hypothetical protein